MSAKAAPKPNPAREAKLRYIGSAHVLPAMSQARLQAILATRQITDPTAASVTILDAIIADIRAVTETEGRA